MACTSIQNSSSSRTKSFDVFVSFRGTDTRNGFTDHLFAAFERKGVVAFRDDHKIAKGELLEPELFQAIEGSRVFIVVFSKDYASSTWCLKELTKIVDWVQQTGRSVLPVFFDVTPSEVRKQTGMFGEAFAEHQERFKNDLEMVQKWREALKAITNRCGWEVLNKPQHGEIEKIVEEVINILGHNQILSFGDDLVDMHSRVKQLEDLLNLGANEFVRVIGICGMGGIGKTTLATALYNKISPQYDACCFVDDVSKIYGDFGPIGAQKQLLCQALNQVNIEISNLSVGAMLVRTRLCNIKTLIVLDNVDQLEQLEKLALNPKYIGAGSRIIVISRDSHILRNYGVSDVYNVQTLNRDKALQLFCKRAFKSDDIVKDYEVLTYDVLKYANGLPLAIKVLGSFLFDRDASEWKSALAKLKENPSKDIMGVLRISFDGLEELEKEIFLDIACFYSNELHIHHSRCQVMKLLDYRGFYPVIGIKVLIEKSLISCEKHKIEMHDLLRELGRSIVREKSPREPGKWSRLWNCKDLHNVVTTNKEVKNPEAIVIIQHPEEFLKTTMTVDALSKMNHLKLLKLVNVNFSGILNYLSNDLKYLYWDRYPFMSLPSSFHPDQLEELLLPYSNIKKLWEGKKCLPNLKILDLRYSKNLTEMPDLRGVPHLEQLDLEGCVEIVRIDPSIGILRELYFLNLKNCTNLVLNLNVIFGLRSLKSLNLSGCSKLINNKLLRNPRETEHLEEVETNRSAIQLSTSSVYESLMVPFYFLFSPKHEGSLGLLLPYLSRFPSLYHLDLSFCNLLQIPEAIGNLYSLEMLNLGGNKFVTLPTTIKELSNLRVLNLEHCKQLKLLPELPTIKEKNRSKRFFGELYIFDCPKLSAMEHCYSIVYYWLMQNLEVCLQPSVPNSQMGIVIAGTQIPKWFNKQNVGNSISMDPSPLIDDPNWIGVACCVSFVTHDDPNNLGHIWHLHDYESIGYGVQNKQAHLRTYMLLPILFKKDVVTVELDHLFILFYSQKRFIEILSEDLNSMHDLDKVLFETQVYCPQGLNLEMRNCGYRWVFKEDLQQLNPDMMFSGNSSCQRQKCVRSY